MAAVTLLLREEGCAVVGADAIVSSGDSLEEEKENNTRQTKGARAEGASTSSAVARRVEGSSHLRRPDWSEPTAQSTAAVLALKPPQPPASLHRNL